VKAVLGPGIFGNGERNVLLDLGADPAGREQE
jgi:hypothetical protein